MLIGYPGCVKWRPFAGGQRNQSFLSILLRPWVHIFCVADCCSCDHRSNYSRGTQMTKLQEIAKPHRKRASYTSWANNATWLLYRNLDCQPRRGSTNHEVSKNHEAASKQKGSLQLLSQQSNMAPIQIDREVHKSRSLRKRQAASKEKGSL